MKQIFLTFKNEAEFKKQFAESFNDDGEIVNNPSCQIDVLGTIYKNDAEYDEDGEIIKQPTKLDGFHVNVLCDEKYEKLLPRDKFVTPKTPFRVFNGFGR